MKIYIDFDDVICETARDLTVIAERLFGIVVPYDTVMFFNLQDSFGLDDKQYIELMNEAHTPEVLLGYNETPGASQTINKWVDEGHEVSIITGRPFSSYELSREWLDQHDLSRVPLFCVDKYGREIFKTDGTSNLNLEELYQMTFDFAVEDSPVAFEHVLHLGDECRVAVFNRPWNIGEPVPNERFKRCAGWGEIDQYLHQK